jgi:hypothetical protein
MTMPDQDLEPIAPVVAPPPTPPVKLPPIELVLPIMVTLMMFFLGYLTFQSLTAEITGYDKILNAAISWRDPYALFGFARARDFAMLKSATIFMGFILIFVGCLYVLRKSISSFALDAGKHGSLQTTSPGLVMVTLGVVLVLATLHWTSTIEFESQRRPTNPSTTANSAPPGEKVSVEPPNPAFEGKP